MSNRKIIMLIIAALAFGGIFFLYKKQAQEQEAQSALVLGYEQETFLKEGGYTAARNYADSIFTELYCNTKGIVYQYAFTDNLIDIPHRELMAAAMVTSPAENHLYLEYRIPMVKNVLNEDGKPTNDWSYTGAYEYVVMDMRNVARVGDKAYNCYEFSIILQDTGRVMENALDTNGSSIPSDGELRTALDYGVLFNIDENLATSMANREKNRISSYLLAKQRENAAPYVFSTDVEKSVPANLNDYTETLQTTTTPTPEGAPEEQEEIVIEEVIGDSQTTNTSEIEAEK